MSFTDFSSRIILNTFGKTQLVLAEACEAGDLLTTTGVLADDDEAAAKYVACEAGAISDVIWVCLAAIVKKPPTKSTRGDIYTRGDHGGSLGDAIYLENDGGTLYTAGHIAQVVGHCLEQDTILLCPSNYLVSTSLQLSGTLTVDTTSILTGNATFGGRIISDDTTQPTNTTSGAIQTDGGIGVAKKGFFGDDVTITAGKFLVGSPQKMTITAKGAGAASLTAAETGIILAADGAVLTLPAVATSTGFRYIIKVVEADSAGVVVDATSTETIDGDATAMTSSAIYDLLDVVCDGSEWHVIGIMGTWTT